MLGQYQYNQLDQWNSLQDFGFYIKELHEHIKYMKTLNMQMIEIMKDIMYQCQVIEEPHYKIIPYMEYFEMLNKLMCFPV